MEQAERSGDELRRKRCDGARVTAILRNPERLDAEHEQLKKVKADVMDPSSLEEAIQGHDAVISAFGPKFGREEELVAARTIVEGRDVAA